MHNFLNNIVNNFISCGKILLHSNIYVIRYLDDDIEKRASILLSDSIGENIKIEQYTSVTSHIHFRITIPCNQELQFQEWLKLINA